MKEYVIPDKIINIIRNTYNGSQARVKVGGEFSDWFFVETGVRQGSVWSPHLFGILIDRVLKKSCDSHGLPMKKRVRTLRGIEDGWKLSDLDIADDVALIEPGEEKSTTALARLRRAREEVGLVVSAKKIKVMPIGETSACMKMESLPLIKLRSLTT